MAPYCQTTNRQSPAPRQTVFEIRYLTGRLKANLKELRIRQHLFLFIFSFVILCGESVRAQDFNFDLITIPTDLVAAIVNTEDDISLTNLYKANVAIEVPNNESTEHTTSATGQVADPQTDSPPVNPENSGSIFSETEPDELLDDSPNTEAVATIDAPTGSPTPSSVEENANLEVAISPSDKSSTKPKSGSIFDNIESTLGPETNADLNEEQLAATGVEADLAETPELGSNKFINNKDKATANTSTHAAVNQSTLSANEASTQDKTIEPVVTPEQESAINEDEIIIAWATAWSNNQTEEYLAFYADEFSPANKALTRSSWEQQRRKRLQNKDIRIIVSNAEVFRVTGDITEVRFTQRYTSKSYRDRVIKSIEMTKTEKGWQFLSEKTLKNLPFE